MHKIHVYIYNIYTYIICLFPILPQEWGLLDTVKCELDRQAMAESQPETKPPPARRTISMRSSSIASRGVWSRWGPGGGKLETVAI